MSDVLVEVPQQSTASPTRNTDPRPAAPWLTALRTGGGIWLAGNLMLAVLWLLSRLHGVAGFSATTWLRWDALNYLRIADDGYLATTELPAWTVDPQTVLSAGWPVGGEWPVWLPGYPIMINLMDRVLPGGSGVASLAVSNLAALGLFIVLYQLVELEFGARLSSRTVLLFTAFPTAFFLFAGYNGSLFLLLAVSALYAIRRCHWWSAGLFAALAGATRTVGVLLVLPFAYEYLRQRGFSIRRIRWNVLSIALIPAGLATYMIYLWRLVGDPLAFSHRQLYWGRGSVEGPWVAPWMNIQKIRAGGSLNYDAVINLIDLSAAIIMIVLLVLCVVGPWRLRTDQLYLVIFGAAGLLLALCTPLHGPPYPMQSMARYAIEVIPAFVLIARICENRQLRHGYLMIGLAAQGSLVTLYLGGHWAG